MGRFFKSAPRLSRATAEMVIPHSFREAPALAERQVRGSALYLGSASLTEGKAPLKKS